MTGLSKDFRFALRTLWSSPGFSLPAILALALGIGATTVIVSYAEATSLRIFGYRDALRLEVVEQIGPNDDRHDVHAVTYVAWEERASSLSGLAATSFTTANLTGVKDPEPLFGSRISASLLPLLGVEPAAGRRFAAFDEQPTSAPVVMISQRLWQRRYQSDPAVIGQAIRLNDTVFTVVGVMPDGLYSHGPISAFHDYWIPLVRSEDAPGRYLDRDAKNDARTVYARLRQGVGREQARAELEQIAAAVAEGQQPDRLGWRTRITPYYDRVLGRDAETLAMFWAASAALLLIACANVALMMLARSNRREREFAVRLALGASRRRLIRQLLAESFVLAVAGGAAGVALAYVALPAVVAMAPPTLRQGGLDGMSLDSLTLSCVLATSVATALGFGLTPALRSARLDLQQGLQRATAGTGTDRSGRILQDALVAVAIGCSVALLITSSLLAESFFHLRNVDPGYHARRVLTARLPIPLYKYAEDVRGQFYLDVVDRIRALPGVEEASAAVPLPMGNVDTNMRLVLEGESPRNSGEMHLVRFGGVTGRFFESLGIPVLAGRSFDRSDQVSGDPVILVNQAAALEYWPGENPLGKRVNFDPEQTEPWATVVGVVGDVRYRGPGEGAQPTVYRPVTQGLFGTFGMTLLIRTEGEPMAVAPAVRRELSKIDPDAPLGEIRTMEQVLEERLSGPKYRTAIVGLFTAAALALALVGVFGVVSYSVSRQTRDIGLRKALGARAPDIVRLVLGRTSLVVAAGLMAGAVGSRLLTSLLAHQLYGVQPGEPAVTMAAGAALAVGALVAAAFPTLRATRIAPMDALREE